MPRYSAKCRQIFRNLCVIVFVIIFAQSSMALAQEPLRMTPEKIPKESPKIVPALPPGFFSPQELPPPELWDPGVPGQCNVVYSTSIAGAIPYKIQGGGNAVVGDMNYLFYFPVENIVLSFIDPRLTRAYPPGMLQARYGITLAFEYTGGFPPGFEQLGQDMVTGNVTHVPGDKWSRVVISKYPFIKRSPVLFDYSKHCRFNKDCFCLKKSK